MTIRTDLAAAVRQIRRAADDTGEIAAPARALAVALTRLSAADPSAFVAMSGPAALALALAASSLADAALALPDDDGDAGLAAVDAAIAACDALVP